MTSTPHPLEGCWTKLRWAKVNLETLQCQVASFFGDESDQDSPRGHLESQARGGLPDRRFEPPWHWPLLVGDIIHSFRSSLDYLVWELARLNLTRSGETCGPSRTTQFPIVRAEKDWAKVSASQLVDVGESERARIQNFQPYKVESSEPPALAMLADLSNHDKHRTLQLLLVQSGALEESLEEGAAGWAMVSSSYPEHMEVFSPEGKKKADLHVKATYQIALNGTHRIDWILDTIGPKVAEIVRAFEPIFEDT